MRAVLVGLIFCSLVGCKKKESTSTTETSTTKTTEATGSGSATTTTTTTTTATTGSADTGSAVAPAAGGNVNGAPVDICGSIPKDKVEAAVGKVTGDPQKADAQGSLLGQCSWMTDAGMAMVSARPASEYDGTVSMWKGTDLPGLGQKASDTGKTGLMVQPAGKPYFVQVIVMGTDGKADTAKSKALAKVAVDNLK